jgi:hypothetical protein
LPLRHFLQSKAIHALPIILVILDNLKKRPPPLFTGRIPPFDTEASLAYADLSSSAPLFPAARATNTGTSSVPSAS